MSITLLCLVKGNTLANAFAIDIESEKLVSHLKEAIKEKKQNGFANINANKLKLWKVSIPIKQQSQALTAVSKFNINIKAELGGVELSPFDNISEHFDNNSKKLIKKNLHIIIEPPTEYKEVICTASLQLMAAVPKKQFFNG